ncbi:hypothetical protein [Tepidiforma sp.]|nr:hypothetical protein [Tepidiforma sp.]MCX7618278.1 hypothetical protein [Tepidiforma sp.]
MTHRITIRVRQPVVHVSASGARVTIRVGASQVIPAVLDCGTF